MISGREKKQGDLWFEWKKPIVTMAFFLVLSLIFFSSESGAAVYTYTELLSPGSSATGINDFGVVIGYGGGTTTGGFIYDKGNYTELLPPGWTNAGAIGINDFGVVVGYGTNGTGTREGFIYNGGKYTELLPPGWTETYTYGINNFGVVVGYGLDEDTGTGEGFIAYP